MISRVITSEDIDQIEWVATSMIMTRQDLIGKKMPKKKSNEHVVNGIPTRPKYFPQD